MTDSRFYEGFEGEAELTFVADNNKLVIWNGYFETILDNLLDCNVEKEGIVKKYFNHEGWYDNSPWLIKDNSLTINQLKRFNINKINQALIKDELEEVVQTIISFLETNRLSKIYIEYE
ncbi:hypothetical protein [Lactiplantibacillus plantarum]|uniref:hypothetical protein n=1 Tax=Lactiplantibacillus plantarum TaxID=1590 RepID=UPI000B3EA971|nr:hypothetical protein [Lactiplantibacillus plantarum]ARW14803.1 hypothetical protein S100434_02696 [Lactiplantibacillus plantarum subsp. plantarum]MYU97848.1 hypothetical protein [Lactiplantibacillus plantarum]QHM22132.1 hypothetical protein C7M31_01605 [Lactiplantibacillus plantarum]QHM24929.1 hypothetical protein C7M32_01450 [Lactiplantibacillus plantarum]QHM28046.1 hypothetical protein C7M33_01605 [Lactiplantibacillus plantarum]